MGESADLGNFIDEMLRLAKAKNYVPYKFVAMRQEHGTVEAINLLVKDINTQSGFKRLNKIGLGDWTIECALMKFPSYFKQSTRDFAKIRIQLEPLESAK